MKTTLEIDDDLFIATKAAAARRRTTMRSIVEHALRRELAPDQDVVSEASSAYFKTGKHGLPVLKKSDSTVVSSETVYQMMEDEGI